MEPAETTIAATDPTLVYDLSQHVVYLLGFSFVLGSLFTILILIVLDVMQRNRLNRPDAN